MDVCVCECMFIHVYPIMYSILSTDCVCFMDFDI